MKKTKKKKQEPIYAAGNEDLLKKKAGKKDRQKGNYTLVTTLSYDEVDPS